MKTASKRKAPAASVEVKEKEQKAEKEETPEKELPLVTRGVDL